MFRIPQGDITKPVEMPCPFCDFNALIKVHPREHCIDVNCAHCGKIILHDDAIHALNADTELKYKIAMLLTERLIATNDLIELTTDIDDKTSRPRKISLTSFLGNYPVTESERIERILLNLLKLSDPQSPSSGIPLDDESVYLFYVVTVEDMIFMAKEMEKRDLVLPPSGIPGILRLTSHGRVTAENIQKDQHRETVVDSVASPTESIETQSQINTEEEQPPIEENQQRPPAEAPGAVKEPLPKTRCVFYSVSWIAPICIGIILSYRNDSLSYLQFALGCFIILGICIIAARVLYRHCIITALITIIAYLLPYYFILVPIAGSAESVDALPEGMVFVSIPYGNYQMGSHDNGVCWLDGQENYEARPTVHLDSFEIMTTEVTQAMWEFVIQEPFGARQESLRTIVGPNFPVFQVSWYECQEFVDSMNSQFPIHTYSLPSEAQWEYCSRYDSIGYYSDTASWSDDLSQVGWCIDNSGINPAIHEVGVLDPNPFGLYDMYGNVWEWCQDNYLPSYASVPLNGDPLMISEAEQYVRRGGGYKSYPYMCSSTYRQGRDPNTFYSSLGFRLVRVPTLDK